MTNLYNVDTTGRSYALDAAPLMKIDDKRVATETSRLQAVSDLAKQGAMAAETYTARKQLASLSTSQQQLKPGSPEFERDVANLIQQHPLAFNNPFTANAAKAGLSSLASAHAQALKQQDQTQQNDFTLKLHNARYSAEKELAETRYRKPERAPLNLDDPSAVPTAEPSQNPSSNMPAGSGEAGPLPDGPGGVKDDLLNIPEPPLPAQEPIDPYTEVGPPDLSGVEGPVGAKGVPAMPVAPSAVKIDTKPTTVKKSDAINIDDKLASYMEEADKREYDAKLYEHNGTPEDLVNARKSAQAAFKAKKDAATYKNSEEYQQGLKERVKKQEAEEIAARAPEVSAALAGGYPELGDLHGEMEKEVSGAKSKVELARLQSKWSNKMATARQLMQSEGKLPDDPSKIEEVALKRDAVVRAAQLADAAENEVGKYADKVKPGASPEVVAYANKLKSRRDAAQAKAQKEAEAYDILKTKVGMNEPEDTTDTGPKPDATAKVEDAYAARVGAVEPKADGYPSMDEVKNRLVKEHPGFISSLEDIAKRNPALESNEIDGVLDRFRKADGDSWKWNEEADKIFGKMHTKEAPDLYKLSKEIVQDFRARMNAPKQSVENKGWKFQQVK